MIKFLQDHLDNFDSMYEVVSSEYTWAVIKPQSKQSTRFGGHAYTSNEKRAYVNDLVTQLNCLLQNKKFAGPLSVTVVYSFSHTIQTAKTEKPWLFKKTAPDLDNLIKPVFDSFKEKFNDGSIVQLRTRKVHMLIPAIVVRIDVVRERYG